MTPVLLALRKVNVEYRSFEKSLKALQEISLELKKGETLGIVGESGCGKSTLALAVMGLLSPTDSNVSGEIELNGQNLMSLNRESYRKLRGKKMAMIFQDPFSSLNPVLKIEYQLQETIEIENNEKPPTPHELLQEVQLNDTSRILNSYPHQLSGGQRQRVLIAMALSQRPELLIADEPTTALDVTVQDEILKLLRQIQKNYQMGMLFISHNMAIIREMASYIAVMYQGRIVEMGPTDQILRTPQHPYTKGLLQCFPTLQKRQGPIPTLKDFVL
jgi:peptide/nickel transport system ATP-binding protein